MSENAIERLDVAYDEASCKNILTVVLDDGSELTWPFASAGPDVVEELDLLSAGIRVDPTELIELEKRAFATIVAQIAEIPGPIALDPHDEDESAEINGARLAELIDRITLSVSEYDNGWFPRATLVSLQPCCGDEEIELLDQAWDVVIEAVDDTGLYSAFRELGGPFRHDPDWTLTLHRAPEEEDR